MLLVEPTHMLTFSLPRAATVADLPELHSKRRLFFRWLTRQSWGLSKHGWVRETGEQHGQLHVHCLVRMRGSFLPFAEIQRAAARLGLGVPDVQRIWRRQTAAAYVAKYMAKSLAGAPAAESTAPEPRRFGMSNHLTLPTNPDWSVAEPADIFEISPPDPLLWMLGDRAGHSFLWPRGEPLVAAP